MRGKSVLTFYYAENACDGEFKFKDVWCRIASKTAANIHCINVYHCELSTAQLSTSIRDSSFYSSQLMQDIALELENGAIFMFVATVVGKPVDGFLIDELMALAA